MRFRIIASALAVVALSSIGSTALAHRGVVRRAVMLERSGARELHVIVALKIPSGDKRRALDVVFDADHDGRYDAAERTALRRLLTGRALDGLSVATGTSALALEGVETSERIDGADGPIEVMVHGLIVHPFQGGTRITVRTGTLGDPVDLVVLPGSQPVASASRGTPQKGGLKTELGLGDKVEVVFR